MIPTQNSFLTFKSFKTLSCIGAIQIIRDTLGGGGYGTVSPNDTRGREGVCVTWHLFQKKISLFLHDFKAFRTLFLEKSKTSHHTGGGDQCHKMTQGGGGVCQKSLKKVSRIIWMAPYGLLIECSPIYLAMAMDLFEYCLTGKNT